MSLVVIYPLDLLVLHTAAIYHQAQVQRQTLPHLFPCVGVSGIFSNYKIFIFIVVPGVLNCNQQYK